MKYSILVWFAALLCGFFFFNAYQLELFMAAFVTLVLWVCLRIGQSQSEAFTLDRSPFVLCLLGFWALMAFSVVMSEVKFISFIGLCLSSILPLTFFTMVANDRAKADLHILYYAVGGLLAALSVWALIQFYIFPTEFGGQARHPLANPNSLAAVFSLGLFVAIGGALSISTQSKRWLLWALAALLFAGITATASRGAFLAGDIGLLLFAVLNRGMIKTQWRYVAGFIVVAVSLFALTSLNDFQNAQIGERIGRVVVEGDYADITSGRFAIWSAIWAMIQEHWIFGTGIGTFFLYYPEYRLPIETDGVVMGHSDPLQFFAELGVLGPILLYGIGIAFAARTWNAVKALDKGAPERTQIIAVFCGILAMVAHAHVTFNFYVVPILFIGGMMLAWWYVKTCEILGENIIHISVTGRLIGQARQAVLIIPLVLGAGIFASFLISEHLSIKAKRIIASQDLREFTRLVNLSDEIGLRQNHSPYLVAVTVPMSVLEVEGERMTDDKRQQIFQEAWSFLNRAESINPRNASIGYYRGYLLQTVPERFYPDDTKAPAAYYEQAIRLNPVHVTARMELMDIYREKNEMERFEKVLSDGLQWRYNTQKARRFYALAERYYILTEQLDKFGALQKEKKILEARIKTVEAKTSSTRIGRMFGEGSGEL